jgi:hypothetical protein
MGQDFEDLNGRLIAARMSNAADGPSTLGPWNSFWSEWRLFRSCPSSEDLAAYVESGRGFVRRMRIWHHLRLCILCRAEIVSLRQITRRKSRHCVESDVGGLTWELLWGILSLPGKENNIKSLVGHARVCEFCRDALLEHAHRNVTFPTLRGIATQRGISLTRYGNDIAHGIGEVIRQGRLESLLVLSNQAMREEESVSHRDQTDTDGLSTTMTDQEGTDFIDDTTGVSPRPSDFAAESQTEELLASTMRPRRHEERK